MAVRETAERKRATATATSLEETDLGLEGWGRMREEMLAGKEAKEGGDGGDGGDGPVGTDGKKGCWLGVVVENGYLVGVWG